METKRQADRKREEREGGKRGRKEREIKREIKREGKRGVREREGERDRKRERETEIEGGKREKDFCMVTSLDIFTLIKWKMHSLWSVREIKRGERKQYIKKYANLP